MNWIGIKPGVNRSVDGNTRSDHREEKLMVGRERLRVVGKVLLEEPGLRKTEGMEMRMTELSGNEISKRISSRKNSKKGFTLVELLVVLVILAIIAAVAIPAMLGFTDSARKKENTADANAAYKAAQTALTDLFNDASSVLDHDKRANVAKIAGLDAENTRFKVWTEKILEAGVTNATSENVGSYTIAYALFETTNDDTGKYVFYDGNEWTVYDDISDAEYAMNAVGINSNQYKDNVIYLWPDYMNGAEYADTAYPGVTPEKENWAEEPIDDDEKYTLKIHNYNTLQGKTTPGILFKIGDQETGTPDTLNLEFVKDSGNGIISKNWTSEDTIEIKNVIYKISLVDGFENLRWSIQQNPNKITDGDVFENYEDIISSVSALNANGIYDIYPITDKEIEEKKIVFRRVEGSNSMGFGSLLNSQVEVTLKRYKNRYDYDSYSKNKSLNTGDGSISSALKSVKVASNCNLLGWAFWNGSDYEKDSSDAIMEYGKNAEEDLWNKVFSDASNSENPNSGEFVGITEKVKKVVLMADEKGLSSFNGAKKLELKASYNEVTESSSDNFDIYETNKLSINSGCKLTGWEKYHVTPAVSYETVEMIWEEVRASGEGTYTYIAKVGYGSRAKFLQRSNGNDYSDPQNLCGQIRFLFGGVKSNVGTFQKQDYRIAVEVLTNAGIINKIMTGYDNSSIEDDIAIQCNGHYQTFDNLNKAVTGGTIKRMVIMWDGHDETYDVPIFGYNVVSSDNTYHVYWFSRDDHPELVGKFFSLFDKYEKVDFAGSCIDDWNTASCTDMHDMFWLSGLKDGDVDFKKWDYSSVTDMSGMFRGCKKLTSIDFSGCSMPECTSFANLASYKDVVNTSLTSVNFDKLYTPKLSNISGLFTYVNNITTFSARGWNAPSITSMESLFNGKKLLTSVEFGDFDDSYKTDLSGCKSMAQMFMGCTALTNISFEGLDLTSCTTFKSLCSGCTNLTSFSLNKCNTPSLTNVVDMFASAPAVKTFTARGWNAPELTSLYRFMYGKKNITTFDIRDYDEENKTILTSCTTMAEMLTGCNKLQHLSFENVRLDSCKSFNSMCKDCTELLSVNIDGCYTPELTDVGSMFNNVPKLEAFSAVGWKAGKLTSLYNFMYNKDNLESFILVSDDADPDDSKMTDLSGCENLSQLLYECDKLSSVSFKGLDFSACTNVYKMLTNCKELTTVIFDDCNMSSLSGTFNAFQGKNDASRKVKTFSAKRWNAGNITSFENLFYRGHLGNQPLPDGTVGELGLSEIEFVDFEGADLHSVTSMYQMFYNCSNLVSVNFKDAILRPATDDTTVDTHWLFFHCFRLTRVNFDFAEGTKLRPGDMYKFFDYCLSLETVDFGAGGLSGEAKNEKIRSKLDTSGAYDMSNLLYQCGELDPSDKFYEAFQFDSAKRISRMLYGIYNHSSLDDIEVVFTDKDMSSVVTNPGLSPNPPNGLQQMFQDSKVNKVTFVRCNICNMTNTNVLNMFSGSSVKVVEFIDCDMSGLTGFGDMFKNASSVEIIRLNGTDMSGITSLQKAFDGATNLKTFEAKGWNISGVTSMKEMFLNKNNLETFDISDYETSDSVSVATSMGSCTDMTRMFSGCENLQTVLFSDNTDMSGVKTYQGMFNDCKSFTLDAFGNMAKSWNLDGSSINFNNKANANLLINSNCTQFTETRIFNFGNGKQYKIGGSLYYLMQN